MDSVVSVFLYVMNKLIVWNSPLSFFLRVLGAC